MKRNHRCQDRHANGRGGTALALGLWLSLCALPAVSFAYDTPAAAPDLNIEENDDKTRPEKKTGKPAGGDDEDDIFSISGLVVDETKTKVGGDFYYFFTNHWDPVPGNYTITLKELAEPRIGNIIFVSVNDRLIFKRNVKPRSEEVEAAAILGVRVTRKFIKTRLDLIKELEMY